METIDSVAYAENSITGDELRSESIVVGSPMDISIRSEGQILSDHPTSNHSTNDLITNDIYPNVISPLYEVAKFENLLNECQNTLVGNEVNSIPKELPRTILENAVKAVKNLFSPAKGRGIFSRETPHSLTDDSDTEKIGDEYNETVRKSLLTRLDETSPKEDRERISPVIIMETNTNEEHTSNTAVKYSSVVSAHDNTNDSYTTSVSRMEDSFQSTITHFDENIQNEVEQMNEEASSVENCLDSSLNETMKTNENSLDNTLKKNFSICSAGNGESNATLEINASSKIESKNIEEINSETETEGAVTELLNQILPGTGSTDPNSVVSESDDNFLSFQQDGVHRIGPFSSTPNGRTFLKDCSPSERSFSNSVSEKGHVECHVNGDNVDRPNSGAKKDMDNEELRRRPRANESLVGFSFFAIGNEIGYVEKNSPPKVADVEKNFSTSTIIITKNVSGNLDVISAKEETEKLCRVLKKDEEDSIKSPISESQCKESGNNMERNISSYRSESSVISDDAQRKNGVEYKIDNPSPSESKSYVSTYSPRLNEVKPCMNTLNLTRNLGTKAEGDPADETQIPLASQKSYTVLHNPNPDLNRPIVPDYMCDVQAQNLSNIILGSCVFSDVSVFNNYSEEMISQVPKGISISSEARTSVNPSKLEEPELEKEKFGSSDPHKEINDLNFSRISAEVNEITTRTKQECDAGKVFSSEGRQNLTLSQSTVDDVKLCDRPENVPAVNIQLQNETTVEVKALENEKESVAHQGSILKSETEPGEVKKQETGSVTSCAMPPADKIQNASLTENNKSGIQFCDEGGLPATSKFEPFENQILKEDPDVPNSSVTKPEVPDLKTQIEKVAHDVEIPSTNNTIKKDSGEKCFQNNDTFPRFIESLVSSDQSASFENSKNAVKEPVSASDAELTQFIQEQFSPFDIEKICSVVDDVPELNLSKNIVLASQQFDKSFQEKTTIANDFSKTNDFTIGDEKSLSSALDFLDSIKGKPTGRDYSRESLYIKFDPLVQSKHSSELLHISEGDKENLIISPGPKNSASTEPLIPITPLKQTINGSSPLSPLTPVTQKNEPKLSNEKLNKLRELQLEITKSRELFLQMEEVNKEKINNYEREIAKLTGRACILEDKLKESEEMEKSLVKKLNIQNETMNRLKNTMEEYLTYIGKLTEQIEMERMESHKKIEVLTEEREYYMNHLQNTEQAFSDVHSKYEKCKKAVEIYKKNEETYRTSVEDFRERIEQYREKINDIQETAGKEMNRLQEKISEMKASHAQEISRFKAQLRKTELKVQTVQEALDQKVKENQELARICDELIDGKKQNC